MYRLQKEMKGNNHYVGKLKEKRKEYTLKRRAREFAEHKSTKPEKGNPNWARPGIRSKDKSNTTQNLTET